MNTYLSAEDQLRESGCTDEDIAIMKQLFGDEAFNEVKSLKSNKDDDYGKVVESWRSPNTTQMLKQCMLTLKKFNTLVTCHIIATLSEAKLTLQFKSRKH